MAKSSYDVSGMKLSNPLTKGYSKNLGSTISSIEANDKYPNQITAITDNGSRLGVDPTRTNASYLSKWESVIDAYNKNKTPAATPAAGSDNVVSGKVTPLPTITAAPKPTTTQTSPAATSYTPTSYSGLTSQAQQAPQQYQAYDYSGLLSKANQAPTTYSQTDYSPAASLASRNTQVSGPSSVLGYSDVLNKTNQAANTLSTPQYQNSDYISRIANDIYQGTDPIRRQQAAGVNQQYNQSARSISEALASKGLLRGGAYGNQLMQNEQNRNTALSGIDTNALANAYSQALNAGQLGLAEQGQLTSQRQTEANQLASLLGQQSGEQQWATGFNANQNQNQFANTLATTQAQAGENYNAANFAATQTQNQFSNMLAANQLAAEESRYGQQFNINQGQNQFSNLLALQQAQAGENQFGAQYGLNQQSMGNQLAMQQAQLAQNQNQFNTSQQDAKAQFLMNYGLNYGNIAGGIPETGANWGDWLKNYYAGQGVA